MISEAELLRLDKTKPAKAALLRAVRDLGGVTRTAHAIKKATREPLTPQAVRLWIANGRAPESRAQLLAALTDQRVPLAQLLAPR